MENNSVAPDLPDITEVIPMNESDSQLISEITEVLRKHNALSRFGITLLHKHFDVGQEEVLFEVTDVPGREQTIRPVRWSDIDEQSYTVTSWRLDTGEPVAACVCGDYGGGHQHFPRPSDSRLKENVEPLSDSLAKILALTPTSYTYSEESAGRLGLPKSRQLGLIAQDVSKVVPEAVALADPSRQTQNRTAHLTIDYVSLIPVLIGAIKEQQNLIDELRGRRPKGAV